MTTTPQTRARRKSSWLIVLALLGVAGAGAGGYFLWGPRRPAVPEIATEGLDPEVVAAIDKARAAVKAQPRSAAAWGRLGMVLFAQGMEAESVGVLAQAERLDPRDPRWPYFRGLALIREKPGEGIAALEHAAALAPNNLTVRLRLAEEYLKLDRSDEADTLFAALLEDHPDNPRALLGRGQILSRRGHWREALAPLKKAAEHPVARRSARVALAETYHRLGDPAAEAERKRAAEVSADVPWPDEFLLEAKELRTGLQPRIDQALGLLRDGAVEEAGELISQVLADHPGSAEAHLTRAKILLRAGDYEEAQNALRKTVELNGEQVDGHFLLAGILVLQKEYEAAERAYLRTLELKPTHAMAHYNLGDCRLKRGNKAGAAEAFRAAVRVRPDLGPAHLELGALLLEEGKVEEAITHLETAVRLDSSNERGRALLAQARAKKP